MRAGFDLAVLLTAGVLVSCAGSEVQRGASRSVSATEVRAEVDRHVCAVWSEEAQQWSAEFLAETCRTDPAQTELARAIGRAIARARLVVPLASGAYDRFYNSVGQLARHEQEKADALARGAFWDDPDLERAAWTSVCHELRAEKLSCGRCETVPAAPKIQLSWQEFVPYLRAYVWPQRGEGDTGIEIFVCSDVNGASELPASRERAQAGFLAAAGLADDPEVRVRVMSLAEKHRARSDVAEVKKKLEVLLDAPDIRRRVCAALAQTEWFTGVSVRDC
ncbi:MAG TPA: hypothetical protein VIK91_22800 [Nannocystis sp.]